MLTEDKKRAAYRALQDRILNGEGRASPEQRACAFGNAGLSPPLDELIGKVATRPTQVMDVKAAVHRMTIAQAYELAPHQASAVAVTPGWMRSEDMLDFYGVTEETWREATAKVPHFCISESPAFTGRAVTALACDAQVARWSGQVVSTGQLAPLYGFTDTDGTQPDCWRYVVEVQDKGIPANDHGYR